MCGRGGGGGGGGGVGHGGRGGSDRRSSPRETRRRVSANAAVRGCPVTRIRPPLTMCYQTRWHLSLAANTAQLTVRMTPDVPSPGLAGPGSSTLSIRDPDCHTIRRPQGDPRRASCGQGKSHRLHCLHVEITPIRALGHTRVSVSGLSAPTPASHTVTCHYRGSVGRSSPFSTPYGKHSPLGGLVRVVVPPASPPVHPFCSFLAAALYLVVFEVSPISASSSWNRKLVPSPTSV